MQIKKLKKEAILPTYATKSAAGLDLYVLKDTYVTDRVKLVGTGIAVAIPEGHVGLLSLRSSLCLKGVRIANGVGIIDADYRGEIKIPLCFDGLGGHLAAAGHRVAQLVIMPYKQQTLELTKRLTDTDRDEGGFGSTGQ